MFNSPTLYRVPGPTTGSHLSLIVDKKWTWEWSMQNGASESQTKRLTHRALQMGLCSPMFRFRHLVVTDQMGDGCKLIRAVYTTGKKWYGPVEKWYGTPNFCKNISVLFWVHRRLWTKNSMDIALQKLWVPYHF